MVVVSKTDISAAIDFDRELLLRNIERVRPGVAVFEVSAKTGDGLDAWGEYLIRRFEEKRAASGLAYANRR